MWEITRTVSRILHIFTPTLPHFTQTPNLNPMPNPKPYH